MADLILYDAVLMRLELIHEHLARMRFIDEERFAAVAHDGWYQLIGLLTIISYGYERIETERIWQLVSPQLPALRASLAWLTDEKADRLPPPTTSKRLARP